MGAAAENDGRRIQHRLRSPRMSSRSQDWIMGRFVEQEMLKMQNFREFFSNRFGEECAKKRSCDEERKEQGDNVHHEDKIHKKLH